jgi:hypothetical protein
MIRLPRRSKFAPGRTYQTLPLDLLSPILSELADPKDWHACALVSKAFNKAATPLLYRKLDSRIISTVSTKLAAPEVVRKANNSNLCSQLFITPQRLSLGAQSWRYMSGRLPKQVYVFGTCIQANSEESNRECAPQPFASVCQYYPRNFEGTISVQEPRVHNMDRRQSYHGYDSTFST